MSTREFTCVVCPNGCPIVVTIDDDETPVITHIEGSICKKGEEWAHQEIENPMRTIASSVVVRGGDALLASVRTNRPIPLARIMSVMEEIRKVTVEAPLAIGDVVLHNPAGCDTDIVATRSVNKQ